MAEPSIQQVHLDQALSNISIGYRNDDYIAKEIFPQIDVQHQSDKYFIWNKDQWFRNYVEERAPMTPYPRAGLTISDDEYYCRMYHLAYPLADEVLANADEAIDEENTGSEWLADQFELNMEQYFVDNFFKTGVWGTDLTLSGQSQWSDYANSNPIVAIDLAKRAMRKKTGMEPNVFVIGREVYDILKEHPKLIAKFEQVQKSILSQTEIESALDIPIKVGNAILNGANEGQTFSGDFIWKKKGLLAYVEGSPGKRKASAGYSFVWNKVGGMKVTIERERIPGIDGELLKGKHAWGQKIIAKDLGYFFDAVVA